MYWINGKSRAGRMATQLALMVSFLFAGGTAMSYEQPDYTVLYIDGDIEYRQYEPYLVSETLIENKGDSKDAGNEGFRRLFRYITGSNESQALESMRSKFQGGKLIRSTCELKKPSSHSVEYNPSQSPYTAL